MGFGTGSLARLYGPQYAFQHVKHVLQESDIVFGNCEGTLSNIGLDLRNIDTMEFRGLPGFANAFYECGFKIVTIANNHVGEHGLEVLYDTIANLRAAGLEVIGLRDETRTAVPLVQEIKGVRIGWLAYTWIVSKHSVQDRKVLSWVKGKEVIDEVKALRPDVDYLIVTPHWGLEYVVRPPQSVIEYAHAIADAGADLVLGHHPHVLQGVEQRGKCVIAYSLGNFIFDMWQPWLRETALFSCTLRSGKVQNVEIVPLKINRNFQPELATPVQSARVLRKIERSTRAINDPKLESGWDPTRAKRIEAKFKRRLFYSQIPYLMLSLQRMGFRIAYEKMRRRMPILPLWR
jgi:poly-gamma-glutamate synthesis protein (capsule biosynthesis protein)